MSSLVGLAAGMGARTLSANGGVECDVVFEAPGPEVDADLHGAYHAKYDRYGARMVGTVVSREAAGATLRLVPR